MYACIVCRDHQKNQSWQPFAGICSLGMNLRQESAVWFPHGLPHGLNTSGTIQCLRWKPLLVREDISSSAEKDGKGHC